MEDINIGTKVQEYRNLRGLSLRELAKNTGLTPSMVSQIENNAVNPSINTLKLIAEVLEFPLFYFFQDDPLEDKMIVRNGSNKKIGQAGEEVMYKLLTPDTSGMIEFCYMDIPAGKASGDKERMHRGEEVAYVISGSTSIWINDNRYEMQEGDSIRIPAMANHRWVNESGDKVAVIFAVTPPSF